MQKQRPARRKTVHILDQNVIEALALSEELKLEGEHQKALDIAEKILIDDPECVEAGEEIADNLLSLDRLSDAKKAAQYVLSLHPESYIGNFVIGFAASNDEDWQKAIRYFRLSNTSQPNNPEILRCLGWALFHAEHETEGVATLRRALFLREDDSSILCDLAACLLQQNEFGEAVALIKKALTIDPDEVRVQELFDVANRLQIAYSEDIT